MQISKVKEIGEVLSIVAVLVTLIFLIVEVRENTAAIRTESYGESIARLNDWRLELAADRNLSRLFVEFNSGEEINPDAIERQQIVFIISSLWNIYESAYFANDYGTLGESEWVRMEQMMCRQFNYLPARPGFWEEVLLNQLSPEFRSFVEATCG